MGTGALLAECWRLLRTRRENPLVGHGGWMRAWLLPLALFAASCALAWLTYGRSGASSVLGRGFVVLANLYFMPAGTGWWLLIWLRELGPIVGAASLLLPLPLAAWLRPRFATADCLAELRTTPLHPREILFGALWPMLRAQAALVAPMVLAVAVCLLAACLNVITRNSDRLAMHNVQGLFQTLAAVLLAPSVSVLFAVREFARTRRFTLAGQARCIGGTLAVLALALLVPRILTTELTFLYDELWNPLWTSQFNDVIHPSQRWLALASFAAHGLAALVALLATVRHTLDFSGMQFVTLEGDDALAREWWRGDGVEPSPRIAPPITGRVAALAAACLAAVALVQLAAPRPGVQTANISVETRVIRRSEPIDLQVDLRGHEPPPVEVNFAASLADGANAQPHQRVFTQTHDNGLGYQWTTTLVAGPEARSVAPGIWRGRVTLFQEPNPDTVMLVHADGTAESLRGVDLYVFVRRRADYPAPAHPALDAIARGIGIPGGLVVFLFAVAIAALRVPRASLPAAKPLLWAAQSLSRPAFLFGSVLLALALLEGRLWGPGQRHVLESYLRLLWYFIAVGGAVFLASMRALIAIPMARRPRLAAALWIIGGALVALWLNRSAVAAGNMVLLPLTDGTPRGIGVGLLASAALLHFGFGEALCQRLRDERMGA